MRVSNELNSEHLNYLDTENSVGTLTSLFYQSKFSEILAYNDKFITSAHEYTKVKLLKSKALFELNRKEESFALIHEVLSAEQSDYNPDYIYVKASL